MFSRGQKKILGQKYFFFRYLRPDMPNVHTFANPTFYSKKPIKKKKKGLENSKIDFSTLYRPPIVLKVVFLEPRELFRLFWRLARLFCPILDFSDFSGGSESAPPISSDGTNLRVSYPLLSKCRVFFDLRDLFFYLLLWYWCQDDETCLSAS